MALGYCGFQARHVYSARAICFRHLASDLRWFLQDALDCPAAAQQLQGRQEEGSSWGVSCPNGIAEKNRLFQAFTAWMALQIIPAVVHCQSWGQPPGQLGGERDRMKETGFALDFSVAAGLGIEKALSNTKTAPSFRLFCSKTSISCPTHFGIAQFCVLLSPGCLAAVLVFLRCFKGTNVCCSGFLNRFFCCSS